MSADERAWEQERRELLAMANAGELAGPLAHEVNNFLNVLLLQLAVIEQTVPPDFRTDLTEVRRQGRQLGELVKHWQHHRKGQSSETVPLDLNGILQETIAGLHSEFGDVPLRLEPAPALPPISGSRTNLRRLCTFLVANAASAARHANGEVTIRTTSIPGRVILRVEDTGAAVAPQALPHLFEPDGPPRDGTDRLEIAACRVIVRRMQGTLQAENLPTQGLAMVVELPVA
jgi:signal transduction histidine kinase